MGMLDKFLNIMRLNTEDDDDYYDDDYDDDDYEEEKSKKKRKNADDGEEDEERKLHSVKTTSKITPMRSSKKQGAGMEVCVFKPTSMEDSREITETLLLNRTVVLNVEGLDVDLAQRTIDFVSGSSYAMDGKLQKVSNYIFIITPPGVDISGDVANIINEFDIPPFKTQF